MKLENEITVLVKCSYEKLHDDLTNKGFKVIDDYQLNDIYLKPKDLDINNTKVLDILSKCVLIRNIDNEKVLLTYKYKKYDENENIVEQGKSECLVRTIDEAFSFMNAIGYDELLRVNDRIMSYSNGVIDLGVQLVNDKYIFIELEDENSGKTYDNIEEMKYDIKALNIDIDCDNFFYKKAEIIFNEMYNENLIILYQVFLL